MRLPPNRSLLPTSVSSLRSSPAAAELHFLGSQTDTYKLLALVIASGFCFDCYGASFTAPILTLDEAIESAGRFVREQGYTDAPSSEAEFQHEFLGGDDPRPVREILEARRSSVDGE